MIRKIFTERAPAAIGPYSQAVEAGGVIYVSGQIPIVPSTGAVVEGGIERQARQVLENMTQVLAAAGASLGDVVKTTIFLQDLSHFQTVNAIYAEYFQEPYPARSTVQVARLPRDVWVEIEAVAVKSGKEDTV